MDQVITRSASDREGGGSVAYAQVRLLQCIYFSTAQMPKSPCCHRGRTQTRWTPFLENLHIAKPSMPQVYLPYLLRPI